MGAIPITRPGSATQRSRAILATVAVGAGFALGRMTVASGPQGTSFPRSALVASGKEGDTLAETNAEVQRRKHPSPASTAAQSRPVSHEALMDQPRDAAICAATKGGHGRLDVPDHSTPARDPADTFEFDDGMLERIRQGLDEVRESIGDLNPTAEQIDEALFGGAPPEELKRLFAFASLRRLLMEAGLPTDQRTGSYQNLGLVARDPRESVRIRSEAIELIGYGPAVMTARWRGELIYLSGSLSEASLRARALRSLDNHPDSLAALIRAAEEDASAIVRVAALECLERQSYWDGNARAALLRIAESARDPARASERAAELIGSAQDH